MSVGASAEVFRRCLALELQAITSVPIEHEYVTRLASPRFQAYLRSKSLDPQTLMNLLADFRLSADVLEPTGEPPACRDEADRKYLHCSSYGSAHYLISWDDDLLSLDGTFAFRILTAAEFVAGSG